MEKAGQIEVYSTPQKRTYKIDKELTITQYHLQDFLSSTGKNLAQKNICV